ncbi:hypothetical protein L1049_017957 [Liquidambar formosana]|uniref:Alpha/beta hydrolase fold-3 domain-containing protein n=1 Tax=Liquidambar formosana TaxID=63359 RepID=A0AAP0R848_LIQFO
MSNFDPYDHLNILKNPDGSITRLVHLPTMPVTGEDESPHGQDVVSKDVTLNAQKKTSVRIFRPFKLPSNDNAVARLPVFIYFHGGCWLFLSTADAMVHLNCSKLASEIPAIIVSVDYRLAPESRLPAQYEDAVDALLWVKQQALDPNGEQWLRDYADFPRCYLYGVCSGGNIVLQAALRALDLDLSPVRIAGVVMNQPMFGGNQRTKSELKNAADQLTPLPALDLAWELTLPPGTDRDHRYCNPVVDVPGRKKIAALGRCLVIGFGGDPMVDRQQDFVQMLVLCGVRVEAKFDNVGFHGIDAIDPRRATLVTKFVKDFI